MTPDTYSNGGGRNDHPSLNTGDQSETFVGIRCPDCGWFFVLDDIPNRPDDCAICGVEVERRHVTADLLFGPRGDVADAASQRELVEREIAELGEAFVHGTDLNRMDVASALHQAADIVEMGDDR